MAVVTGHTATGSAVLLSIDNPDVVNLKEISERLGVAYITTQKWYREHKLPEPLKLFGGRNPIWTWGAIVQWCYDTQRDELLDNARRDGWL